MKPLLAARQLSHVIAGQTRLSAVDLELRAGDRLGLLGVNGAGKSTLLQLLAGVLAPTAGEVQVLGRALHHDGPALRRHIGYLPQRVPLYRELTVAENLAWAGQLQGLHGSALAHAIDRVLDGVQLGALRQRLAGRLSAGMAQRLGLAQALIHRPPILILDEPTAGLDPLQTEQIRTLLSDLPGESGLLLATHLLDDVQRLCDRVILLDNGCKAAEHAVDADTDLLRHFRAPAADGVGS